MNHEIISKGKKNFIPIIIYIIAFCGLFISYLVNFLRGVATFEIFASSATWIYGYLNSAIVFVVLTIINYKKKYYISLLFYLSPLVQFINTFFVEKIFYAFSEILFFAQFVIDFFLLVYFLRILYKTNTEKISDEISQI